MDLVLDTDVLICWQSRSPLLHDDLLERVRRPTNRVFVSVVAIWEIGRKRSLGKLDLRGSVVEAIDRNRFEILPILAHDAARTETLPWHHRDAFDRMLIAQAMERDLTVVTGDRMFEPYDVPIIWA